MNKVEKISISRIFSDLIKADSVIDCREMELFNTLKKEYRLNNDCLRDHGILRLPTPSITSPACTPLTRVN